MPTGYAAGGLTYSKRLGKWVKKQKERTFDYEAVNTDSVSFIVSVFRWYPDYFLDCIRDKNAKYNLELPQRIMLRIFARYRNVYITGVRGLTKTYIILLGNLVEGVLFPGHTVRYCAPNQKQAAALAAAAFHEIEKSYPILTNMWQIRNDRSDMFRITTPYGSEFTMYVTRGATTNAVVGEECGQEGENAFPMDDFVANILPTVRDNIQVNQKKDTVHINKKHQYIGNACSRTNKAYTKLRQSCLIDMAMQDKPYEGYAVDMSWITALLGNLRDIEYFNDLKRTLSPSGWLRECCARYTTTNDDPLISDDTLAKSRVNMSMEDCHCGNNEAIYIVSVDYAFKDNVRNAKCGLAILKLTRFKSKDRRDKFRKQFVYLDSYAPPKTSYAQAQKVRNIWKRYTLNGAQATYLVMDERNGGSLILPEYMKPPEDGLPALCCYKHLEHTDIEQPNALPIIYPINAGTRGARDEDGEMIRYAQVEWEQGNIELLTPSLSDGIEQYKKNHGIKDDYADAQIAHPYKKTDELCQQIQNLTTAVTGYTTREVRRSKYVQRDIWSACKYALRFAAILEKELVRETYRASNPWEEEFRKYSLGDVRAVSGYGAYGTWSNYGAAFGTQTAVGTVNAVNKLLQSRKK